MPGQRSAALGLHRHRAGRAHRAALGGGLGVLNSEEFNYCWDITCLPTRVRGMFFYLYLFVDIFSRKVVGWQVFDCESAEKAAALLEDICGRQGISPNQESYPTRYEPGVRREIPLRNEPGGRLGSAL